MPVMTPFLPHALLVLSLLSGLAGAAEPPRMLFLEDAGHNATAPSGTRTGYAILRREDGTFCFYNPYAPSAEPLSMPDVNGVKHTLRPALPDFIAQWSVYQHLGPAKRWWRARRVGCELIDTPDEIGTHSLHVRHLPNEPSEPDTAVWNFPNGWRGELTARIRLPAGSQGAIFSLNDRFFAPSNTLGEDAAVFQARVAGTATRVPRGIRRGMSWIAM